MCVVLGERLEQGPSFLLAGVGSYQLFQISEHYSWSAEGADSGIGWKRCPVRVCQKARTCLVGCDDAQRIQAFDEQEQRLGIQGNVGAFDFGAGGQHCGVCMAAFAESQGGEGVVYCRSGGSSKRMRAQNEDDASARLRATLEVVAEQLVYLHRSRFEYVTLSHFFHTSEVIKEYCCFHQ